MSSGTGSEDRDSTRLGADADVRVLVVDDHAYLRRVMCELVDAAPGFTAIGDAADGADALRAADALAPDFVLMDIRMPGIGGIGAAKALLERHPGLVVLLVSAQELPESLPPDLCAQAVTVAAKRDLGNALLQTVWNERPGAGPAIRNSAV